MKIRLSEKYKHKNLIDKSTFDTLLKNCLQQKLVKEKAQVDIENKALNYRMPFAISGRLTDVNVISRLSRFGKGRIWWETETNFVKFHYMISLTPIFISSLLIAFPLTFLLFYSKNYPIFNLLGNCVIAFILFCLIGISLSKVRLSSLIRKCISEILE